MSYLSNFKPDFLEKTIAMFESNIPEFEKLKNFEQKNQL